MSQHPIHFAAVAALAALAIATPATAGSCCTCATGCVAVEQPIEASQIFVVNHGPVFDGPGHYLAPAQVGHAHVRASYPYVGQYFYPPDGGPVFYPVMGERRINFPPARRLHHRSGRRERY